MENTILKKGFGIIPKHILVNETLTFEAKAIYLFLSSYADDDRTCYPKRSTIMEYLGIKSKNTYYKHLKLLTDNGYVVSSQRRYKKEFSSNIYFLPTVVNGIDIKEDKGYGVIPREVMQNKNLDVKAKVLYAFFCVYTNMEKTSQLAVKKIKGIIKIVSDKTYYKAIKSLVEEKYLEIVNIRQGGNFSENIYSLTGYDTKKVTDKVKSVVENISKDLKISSEKLKKISDERAYKDEKEKFKQVSITKYQNDTDKEIRAYEEIIKDNIEYDRVLKEVEENSSVEIINKKNFYDNVVNIITDTLFNKNKEIKINGEIKKTELVKNVFLKLKRLNVEQCFVKINTTTTIINNPKAYLTTMLYNSSQDLALETVRKMSLQNL